MPRADAASRVIVAPRERVYTTLVDAEALAVWLPPGEMTVRFERFDLRPGGSYRMVLTYPDAVASRAKTTPSTDIVEARFVDVVPGVRVVHAIDFVSDDPANAGTTTVTFADFVERLRAAGLADEARNGTVRLLGLDEHGPMFGP